MWRKRKTCALLMGLEICTATVDNGMEDPQKIKQPQDFPDSPVVKTPCFKKRRLKAIYPPFFLFQFY